MMSLWSVNLSGVRILSGTDYKEGSNFVREVTNCGVTLTVEGMSNSVDLRNDTLITY